MPGDNPENKDQPLPPNPVMAQQETDPDNKDQPLPPLQRFAYMSAGIGGFAITIWVIYQIFFCACNCG